MGIGDDQLDAAQAAPGKLAQEGGTEGLLAFFRLLPTGDKRIAVLPDLAHCTPLGLKRQLLWITMANFLAPEDAI